MKEVPQSAYRFWWGAHDSPTRRVLCGAVALVFLAFPLSDLASGDDSGAALLGGAAGLAAFVALYLRLFWILPSAASDRRTEARLILAAIAALAVALGLALGDKWLGLVVYSGVAAALALPLLSAFAAVLAATAAAAGMAGTVDSLALQALTFGLLSIALRGLVRLIEQLEAARAQVAELAVSEERLRLSRDLHDLLGHNLSLIALKSELARKLLGRDPAAAAREVRDVEEVARQSLQEARAAVRGLRRTSLAGELGRARLALEAAGIAVTLRAGEPLPAGVESLFGFAVREATTNVVRHSGARNCQIAIRRVGEFAELEVSDDGKGPTDSGEAATGLRGLAERLAETGGTLEAGGTPEGGFTLRARVPLHAPPGEQDSAAGQLLTAR